MTDPKRITLRGPGSQPANPAPEPPADSIATAVLGSLKAEPPAEPSAELLDATDEDAPGFNPFKFQRITVPPGLRADMIRWSREGKKEPPPVDTIPPHLTAEADLDSANDGSDESDEGDDPGSVMPVGGSRAPVLPLRSARNIAIAAGLVLLPLAVLGVASTMRRHPSTTTRTPSVTAPPELGTLPRTAAAAPAPIETAESAPAATVPAPIEPAPVELAPRASATISSPIVARPNTSPAKRTAPPAASSSRSAEPAAPAAPATPAANGGNALDRPFSLPK